MNDLHVLALTVLAPPFILGIFGLWFTVRHLHPFLCEIGAAPWNRGITRRVLFGGVVNSSPEQVVRLQKLRGMYAGLLGLMLLFVVFFMGLGAVAFLGVFIGLNFLMARPFDVAETNK
ncbi:hypothetical protein TRL7639_03713 [Falsiruegeria litorea R37]|uniref:Uncharacterized protein n=1 Tax=Falsiruegeria litorea R37 TaxID=1200284 RepID=A0A1Y5TQ77_9RHOB|nr:hypothetical protein [Falsiruegeria litorea]SLN65715.1 hypothetical protein TRL7639_03713 [Falsiruegeria litorea R37]